MNFLGPTSFLYESLKHSLCICLNSANLVSFLKVILSKPNFFFFLNNCSPLFTLHCYVAEAHQFVMNCNE